MDGIDDSTSVLKRTSLAGTEFPTGPAGVDQPAVDVVLLHSLCEHLGVPARVEHDERLTVAGREGR